MTWAGRWGGIALGATLGALVLFLVRESVPVRPSMTQPLGDPAPTETRSPSETTKVTIFQETVSARERATRQAQAVVPESEGKLSPFGPGSFDKGEGKRAALAVALAARSFGEIAAAHGISVQDVEEIFREGETKRWRRR